MKDQNMIETIRLRIYAASKEQMETFIAAQSVDVLRSAYTEMLDGSLSHPEQWVWYAIWMIEAKDGTHIGDLCFKGINEDGTSEIGYGIDEAYQGCGYATEAVSALTEWALAQPGITGVLAQTEEGNIASQNVLAKVGFLPTGTHGEEGPLFIRRKENADGISPAQIRYVTENEKAFWYTLDKHLPESEFENKVRNRQGYVLFVNRRAMGILRYNLFWDNIPFCTMLYVSPSTQGKGFGRLLMQHWENEMKALGYGMVLTSTRTDESAQHFYRKLGYQDCGGLLLNVPGYEQPMEIFLSKALR